MNLGRSFHSPIKYKHLEAKPNKFILVLLKAKFFKEFLGIFFFSDVVDTDIHKELKNKITTKFKEKRRLSIVP